MAHIITAEMFKKYKDQIKTGDCLVYGENEGGKFMNAMIGEPYDIMVALCCLIQKFAENGDMSPFEVIAGIKDMLQTYADMKDQEGGDR